MNIKKDRLAHTERPTAAAKKIVEVYNDTGRETDPLGMYTGRPLEAGDDYNAVAIPKYDTEAVRYCNGKRYMKPEAVGAAIPPNNMPESDENPNASACNAPNAGTDGRKPIRKAPDTGIPDATSGMHYVMEHIVPTQDADDLQ